MPGPYYSALGQIIEGAHDHPTETIARFSRLVNQGIEKLTPSKIRHPKTPLKMFCPPLIRPCLMQAIEKVWLNLKVYIYYTNVNRRLYGSGSHTVNFQILPNTLLCLHQAIYIYKHRWPFFIS